MTQRTPDRPRVVVIGGGFAGLTAAQRLARLPVDVTLIDRRNFHLFSPLVYQVATGGLAPSEVAQPLRAIFHRRANVRVLLAEVEGFDLDRRAVAVRDIVTGSAREVDYDLLVVGGGSEYSYFGHDEWSAAAPALKTLESALGIRARILEAFEAAETDPDPAWLTFTVIGGGPTGVEIAGQIAELARDTLRRDFRAYDPRTARVLLVEAGDRVLGTMHPALSRKAERQLRDLGVEILTGSAVTDVGPDAVTLAGDVRIASRTAVWAAGVRAAPIAARLAATAGVVPGPGARLPVTADLTLPGHPDVFVVGDMALVPERPLPGTAPVAMQQGRHVARVVRARLRGRPAPAFRYRDKGDMATIGRARAVADLHGVRFGGSAAWALWLAIHLWYLIGFQNRLVTLIRWAAAFLTRGRGSRLITHEPLPTRSSSCRNWSTSSAASSSS